jgi:serine O-acetyltransferase
MFDDLKKDGPRYAGLGGWYANPGFWIGAIYRFGAWAHSLPPLARIGPWILYRVARGCVRILFNVDIWAGRRGAQIGAGLCLLHPSNVIIRSGTVIGKNCLIFHEVTLGHGPVPGSPTIGNDVDIYVGARILGGVTVGDRSMIGPNCVITADVPPQSVILPAPNLRIPRGLSPVAARADKGEQAGS